MANPFTAQNKTKESESQQKNKETGQGPTIALILMILSLMLPLRSRVSPVTYPWLNGQSPRTWKQLSGWSLTFRGNVMTTATDRKKDLNRSGLKKDNSRSLQVETIANSAAIVAEPSIGFLNCRFCTDSPEDTEDCLGRITVGLTRSKSLTVLVSPLDMPGLMGMAQVLAAVAYGIKGLQRGQTTWKWPEFNPDPEQENKAQMERWSINVAPDWKFHPLAIVNQYWQRH